MVFCYQNSSDGEKLLKFKAEGREFSKIIGIEKHAGKVRKNLVFHFGVERHASFPQKPVVKTIKFKLRSKLALIFWQIAAMTSLTSLVKGSKLRYRKQA